MRTLAKEEAKWKARKGEENVALLSDNRYDSRAICPPLAQKLCGKSKAAFEGAASGAFYAPRPRVIANAAPRYRGLQLRERNFRLARRS